MTNVTQRIFPRLVDVHSVRVGQRAREAAQLHGGGLDREGGPRVLLVLRRLRPAARVRGHSLAGNTCTSFYLFRSLCISFSWPYSKVFLP